MKHKGYALLLVLPVLLALTLSAPLLQSSAHNTSLRKLQVLVDARQQLISYAAAYLESYQPTGAGPGHLPCPDTDLTVDHYQVQAGLLGDGPNPPCGKHTIAIGKLPRHISHRKHRYAFHLEDKHSLWYAVDTRFINNPLNRIVNPDTVGRIRLNGLATAVAVVFIPVVGSQNWQQAAHPNMAWMQQAFQGGKGLDALKTSIDQYILITPQSLFAAVSLRVALWLFDVYKANNAFACANNTPCQYRAMLSCKLPLRDRMFLLLLENTQPLKCVDGLSDSDQANRFIKNARLDHVFLQRHWFYRNKWWKFVDFKIDQGCLAALADCRAHLDFSTNEKAIVLRVALP